MEVLRRLNGNDGDGATNTESAVWALTWPISLAGRRFR